MENNKEKGFQETEMDRTLKKFCIRYFYLVILFLFCNVVFFIYDNVLAYAYIYGLTLILHIITLIVIYRYNYSNIKLLTPIYLHFLCLFLYPKIIFYWKLDSISAFMWYAFIPLATAILHFSPKAVRFWSIYTSAIVASVFFVEPYVPDDYALVASHRQRTILNSTTVFMCFVLFFFFTNYIVKILKIKKYNAEPYQEIVDEDVAQESEKEENDAVKLKNLYQEIVLYFDHKKPYCDPDFTVSQLALTLKTNVSYIARSIKQEAGQNFNVFINTYRIRMIKEMMDEDYQDKYTMKYIHTSGGFRYQSTFNKVFKDIEGITPSDYIIDNKKRKEEQLNHEK